jgi:WD40 repeat protein
LKLIGNSNRRRIGLIAIALLFCGLPYGKAQEAAPGGTVQSLPAAQVVYGSDRLRHQQPVQAVQLSPDGRFIASSANDFSVRIWDRATGALVHSLIQPTNRLAFGAPEASTPCLLYSPDGKYLVAGRGDSKILVWETARYQLLHTLNGSAGAIRALTIAPDNKSCVSSDSGDVVRLWNLTEGKEVRQFTLGERANVLAYSPDGTVLYGGCGDGTIRIWQASSLTLTRTIEAHESPVQYLSLRADGALLASVGLDKAVRIWDVRPGANPHTAPLSWVAISGSGLSAVASLFQGLQFFALNREIDKVLCGEAPLRALRYLADDSLLSAGPDGITIWNPQSHNAIRRIAANGVTCLAADAAGRVGASGDANGVVRLWDLTLGKEIALVDGPIWPPSNIVTVPSADSIAIQYRGGPTQVWDAGGRVNKLLGVESAKSTIGALSVDGSLAATLASGEVVVFELAGGKKRQTIDLKERSFSALGLSARAQFLASAGEDKTLSLWSLTGARLVRRFEGGGELIRKLQFTADGKLLAGSPGNDTLILWDVATGKELRRLVESGADVLSFALSADGVLAAVGHPGGEVRIWHTGSGKLLQLLEGHPGPVQSLAFSPNGRALAAGSWLTLKLWEVASGKERLRLYDLPGEVTATEFSDRGGKVLLGMSNTQTVERPLDPPDLVVKDWNSSELDGLWRELENDDASRAYRALVALAAKPSLAASCIRARLKPLAPLDEARRHRQSQAIKHLESMQFVEREKAVQDLEQLADAAEPELRNLLRGNPSSEVRFRVLAILDKLQSPEQLRQRLRGLRCCELLERIATPEAKSVLRSLAKGAAGAWLTVAARESLGRLAQRSDGQPK